MTNIRVFGALGTEVHIDARRYEIVALDEGSVITWRSKCEACAIPIFVTSKEGRLPVGRHCPAHVGRRTKVGDQAEVSDEEARALQAEFPVGLMSVDNMIPPFTPTAAQDGGAARIVAEHKYSLEEARALQKASIQRGAGVDDHPARHGIEGPLLPSYTETMPTAVIPEEENYTPAKPVVVGEDASLTQSLYAELAELEAYSALPPAPSQEQVWRDRMQLYRIQRMWIPSWGPRPGQDGCEVPPEMLEHGW